MRNCLIFGAIIQTHNIVTYTIVSTIFTTVQQIISQRPSMQLLETLAPHLGQKKLHLNSCDLNDTPWFLFMVNKN